MSAEPVTQTAIVNAAAALLGSTERLLSMDDSGNLARHAIAVWALAIRPLIADHPWNFAIRRAALNAGPAALPWRHRYALPVDSLRLLSWADCDGRDRDGVVENGAILTDAVGPLHIRFLTETVISDTSRWPPHLAQVAVYAMAAHLAEPITGQRGLAQAMEQKAADALPRARRIDGLESGRKAPHEATAGRSRWLRNSRHPWAERSW